jgi:hypothetical protein
MRSLSLHREAARRTPRAGATGVLAMRPSHLRPRQAFGAVGEGGGGWSAGPRLPVVSGGGGLGRRTRSVRRMRQHAVVDPAR